MAEDGTRDSCSCGVCQGACTYKPGWFLPGEAEKAAALMDMSLPEFFRTYLGVNYWPEDEGLPLTFLLAPAITRMSPGEEYPADPKGRCVFFQEGRCQIHEARPHECRRYFHTDTHAETHAVHHEVAATWGEHQDQIQELLGREPEDSGQWGLLDELGLGGLFGGWYDDYEDEST